MSDRRSTSGPRRGGSPKVSSEEAAAAAERFLAAVKESEKRDKAQRERERSERAERDRVAAEQKAQANALADARRDLDRAIAAVRRAKEVGQGRAEADAAWKAAKARVIELETGVAPAWAPAAPVVADSDMAPDDAPLNDDEPSADDVAGATDQTMS